MPVGFRHARGSQRWATMYGTSRQLSTAVPVAWSRIVLGSCISCFPIIMFGQDRWHAKFPLYVPYCHTQSFWCSLPSRCHLYCHRDSRQDTASQQAPFLPLCRYDDLVDKKVRISGVFCHKFVDEVSVGGWVLREFTITTSAFGGHG